MRGYDPAVAARGGVLGTGSEAEAAEGADLVLSVNSAASSVAALNAGLAGVGEACGWADLNTASPGTKRELAEIAADHGIPFADVAIMAPVPGRGLRVPMLASGVASASVARLLNSLGGSVEVVAGPAGLAAKRKLLRSVFYKGMAAAVVEALHAARADGCEEWLREVIAADLTGADAATVTRLERGSHRHAVRRTAEMAAAARMLDELGVPADVASAARAQLARLAEGRDGAAR